jgi:adenylate cyclase
MRNGAALKLGGLSFDLLVALIECAPNVASYDELAERVWKGRPVSPETVAQRAKMLRDALSDDAKNPRYFELVRGQGYRLCSPVKPVVDESKLTEKPSIAVLPFEMISGAENEDYLPDGIVEAITVGLACIRSFFVIARNSAFVFKGRVASAIEIGEELGVAYLLEGSVQRHGDRIRITAQLIETANGTHIWAKYYDGALDELFELQDQITASVAGELQPSIRKAEVERSGRKRPQEQGAYDLTMLAMRHVWSLEHDECERALHLLGQALAIDPDYPLALSLMSWCHAQAAVYNWVDDVALSHARARELAERAVELSADDSLILTVLGAVRTMVRDFGSARVLLERAVAVDANAAWAWQRLGWLETYLDNSEAALEDFGRALRLSPLDPMNFNVFAGIGSAHEVSEDYDKAVESYRRAVQDRPNAYWIYRHLASALVGAGDMDGAREAYSTMAAHYPVLTAEKARAALLYSKPAMNRMISHLRKLGLPD